ncbi:MAG: cytochrome B [Bacteroidota bacterium]
MYSLLLVFHSAIRYFVLIFLIVVIVRSFMGWSKKGEFTATDNKMGTWLLMLTHMQFLLGLILYFVSPAVIFGANTMKDATVRYWTVEHITVMLLAVALITVGRVTAKRLTVPTDKHKRMFIFNLIALALILVGIFMSGRGFFELRTS